MDSILELEEMNQISSLTSLLGDLIEQFNKTKEELKKTTLSAQIELLTSRLHRLKISIIEVKRELDRICIPKEASLLEGKLKDVLSYSVKPYRGGEEGSEGMESFSWKDHEQLEKEKKENLQSLPSAEESSSLELLYQDYEKRFSSFIGEEKKASRMR